MEFLHINVPLVVLGDRKGGRQDRARRVDGLLRIRQIHSARHLRNQHWGKSKVSKLLIDTQEVDHHDAFFLFVESHGDRLACYDTSHGLLRSNRDV